VGAAAAIAGSVFVKILRSAEIGFGLVIGAFLLACVVALLFGLFNGMLVAVFNIQPMIATLILYTAGRSIAYWINGGATPTVSSSIISALGGFIPGVPIPTPIFIVIICGLIFAQLLKFTNLGLYTQAVGINHRAARLNGINTLGVKLLSFAILGLCVAVAGCMSVSRLGLINHETLLLEIEMDAILAVAIGGNALGGGKFKMIGSVLGAYAIQTLTTTLYAMKVPSTSVKVYKAVVIIMIVLMGSPVFKEAVGKLRTRFVKDAAPIAVEGK
jgi:simple sugar transport system permease protein